MIGRRASRPTRPERCAGEQRSFASEVPTIALPTGGGAIKGIAEQFTVNAATGTMAMSYALPLTHSWFIVDPSYEDWLKQQPGGVTR